MTSIRLFCALCLALLAGALAPATAQRCVWGKTIPVYLPNSNQQYRAATDPAGNTYILGAFTDHLSLGGFNVTSRSAGDTDLYIAKYDRTGAVRWLRAAGTPPTGSSGNTYNDYVAAIAVDPQGNPFITGTGGHGFALGTLSFDSAGHFLAKLDGATGNPLWLQRLESRNRRLVAFNPAEGGYFMPSELTTDAAGNCYMSGRTSNLDSLGGLAVAGTFSPIDNLIAKCDGTGRFQWVTQIFGPSVATMYLYGLEVGPTGAVTIGGTFSGGTFAFGSRTSSLTLTATDTSWAGSTDDAFVARLAPDGTPLWVKHGYGPTPGGAITAESIRQVVTDAAGNTYVTGACGAGGLWLDGVQRLSSAGNFMMKLDPQGGLTWIRNDNCGSLGMNAWALTLDPSGNPLIAGFYNYNLTNPAVGPYALPPATRFASTGGANSWLAAYTPLGDVRWARTVSEPSRGSSVALGIDVDAAGHIYMSGIQGRAGTRAIFDGQVIEGPCTFLLRFDNAAQIRGTVYLDENGNNLRDAGESVFPRPVVVGEVTRPWAATTSPVTGRYTVFADTGAYQLHLPQVPAYYRVTQGSTGYSGHLRNYGQNDTARTFGLAPIGNRPDVRVTLTPYTAARRGFTNRYRARIENMGTATVSGQLKVQFDAALAYVGAVPVPSQVAGTTATWNFQNLMPFATRDFDVASSVPLNLTLGTVLRSHATVVVSGDLDPTNDVDSVRQIVVGSYDPNDLTVNYSSLTPAQLAANTPLDYTIRFQNLGNDTAFTVVLTDTLPAHLLRLGTLQVVGSSHNCWADILGNNLLVVRFDSINLPPRSTSTLNSLGFVRFQVVPSTALTPGMLIPNTAHITFDYNLPLATNAVATHILQPTGLPREPATVATWSVYPNPTTARATVTADLATAGRVTVQVLDALGRPVLSQSLSAPAGAFSYPLELGATTAGLYVVRLTLPDGQTTTRRLVVGR